MRTRKAPAAASPESAAKLAMAVGLHQQGQLAQAEALYREILQTHPQHFDALQLLATAAAQRSDAVTAVPLFEQALRINPDHAGTLNNFGNALRGLLRLDEALQSFAHAQRIDPGYADAHANEGLCRLLMGHFAKGWAKREWRWKTMQGLRNARNFAQPLWLGQEPLEGKTILLHSEQGFGDTIQFCRYAAQVAALGARVVLEVQPTLKALLKNLMGVTAVLGRGEELPAFDYHCPLMSLPLAFQADMSSISGEPYLQSDADKREQWQSRLGPSPRKRVGLVWSGNVAHANDKYRSLALQDVMALVDSDADYYCLQKELHPADREALARLPGIKFLGDSFTNFSDTAAAVDLMDVVITVDTSVAHLAGALGKEVWVMLSFSPDWRWLMDRSDSPWYGSARLFRQQSLGDWGGVLTQVKAALKARFAAAGPAPVAVPVPPVAASLSAALALHQQGKLEQADVLYQRILQTQPSHFDALQLSATIAGQQGRAADAVVLFERALKINPDHASSLNNCGIALEELNRLEQALASYDHALKIEPEYAEAWCNRGSALRGLGRTGEALQSFESALRFQPDFVDALLGRAGALRELKRAEEALATYERALVLRPDQPALLVSHGNSLRALKRPLEALASYERVLQLRPDSVEAMSNRGNALRDLKRFPEALACYQGALERHPESVEAHNNLGNALWDLKRPAEALACYDRALAIYPDYAQAHSNRGNALLDLKRLDEALASYDRSLKIDPANVEAHNNRGNALLALRQLDEALKSYERALEIAPDYPEALSNRGNALRDMSRTGEALAAYARALQCAPDSPEIHWNEGLCRLLVGDFDMGWSRFEWRWKTAIGSREWRNYPQPYWVGKEPLRGKTILLYAEQGYGDTIQFCRYVRDVAALGAKVVLEVQAPLKTLLSGLDGAAVVLARGESLPDFDYYASLMSMPLAFAANLGTISGAAYLAVDAGREKVWQSRLAATGRKKVGLVWSGNASFANDHNRSASLQEIKGLVNDSFDFYCLQKELRLNDRATLAQIPGITFLGESLKDFSDTSALVLAMDIVITVDTGVAHLAGALGKEVWIMLAYTPDWRWLLNTNDSPWYASVRLFRQPRPGDWTSVVERVSAELHKRFGLAPRVMQAPGALPKSSLSQAAGEKMALAITLHQRGQLDQAETLYKEVLRFQPGHVDALQLLATIYAQRGCTAEAVALFEQALVNAPDHMGLLNNYGNALQDLRRHEEAVKAYENALRVSPDHVEALSNRAAALRELDRPEEALASCERALALAPDHASAHCNRGNILRDLSCPAEALQSFDKAIQIKPDYAEAHNNRGNVLRDLERPAEALQSYDQALTIRPAYAQALNNRGNALRDLGRPDEALTSYDQALKIRPDYVDALNSRGNALRELSIFDEALESLDRALQIDPERVQALNNRGNVLQDMMLAEQALASYERALGIDPGNAETLNNRGKALQDLHRCEEALKSYAGAQQARPDYADAHWNEALCRLLMGDFLPGWKKYEWRWKKRPLMSAARDFPQPLWLGEAPLQGKAILLHSEQGLGDTIQFSRYASQVARLGAKVLLEVQPPLKALLQNLDGVSQVLRVGETLPPFDYHCPLLSLPLAFQADQSNISGTSYLQGDPQKISEWQSRLGEADRMRIGLVWSGGTSHKNDRNRSLAFENFLPLLDRRANFFCLQKVLRPQDREGLEQAPGIKFVGDALGDFSETAALVSLMDLVITVDTSVAHLAGAMGKEVWLLLPFSPDWRWLLGRTDSPWYDSARLFRQPRVGEWGSVLDEVIAALDARLAS